MFFHAGGLIVLSVDAALADDAGLPQAIAISGFHSAAVAQNVRSREEVDVALDQAERAGPRSPDPRPAETFYGGYTGYFADPDGHLWEIAHNPRFTLRRRRFSGAPDYSLIETTDKD